MSKEDKREGIPPVSARRRIDQDPERTRGKSKKDTKRWCRGKEGKEHTLAIEMNPMWMSLGRTCQQAERWFNGCYHEELCTTCGKVTRWAIPFNECPDLKEKP